MPTETLTSGTSWQCPEGVTSVQVETWGGGGAGSTRSTNGSGGGGGGGAYSRLNSYSVTPGNSYAYAIGAAGTPAVNGGDTYWINTSTCLAKGGSSPANNVATGGQGGQLTAGIGDTKYSGGNGWTTTGSGGGGGGSSAGTSVDGNTATSFTGATAPTGGGVGGNGRTGTQGNGSVPASGKGGGGGGGYRTSNGTRTGGNGASGKIILTYDIHINITDANCSFTFSTTGTIIQKIAATVTLAFVLALSGVSVESVQASSDISFNSAISSSGIHTTSNPGVGSLTAFWIGGASVRPDISGQVGISFSPVIEATGTTGQLEGAFTSLLAPWVGGASNSGTPIPIAISGGLSFPVSSLGITGTTSVNQATGNISFGFSIDGTSASLVTGSAGSADVIWDTPTVGTPTGYRLYYSNVSGGPYTLIADVGLVVEYYVSSLPIGVYYIVATAYDADTESGYSNECEISIGGLGYSINIASAGTAQSVVSGTASVSFAFSSDAVGFEKFTSTGDISFLPTVGVTAVETLTSSGSLTFEPSVDVETEQTFYGTGDVSFSCSSDASGTSAFAPITGTGNLSFTSFTLGSSGTNAIGTAVLSFSVGIVSNLTETIHSNVGLSFVTPSLAIAAKEEFYSSGSLSFEIAISGSVKVSSKGLGSLEFTFSEASEALLAQDITGDGNLDYSFGLRGSARGGGLQPILPVGPVGTLSARR
jgi:hypothetical protein